MQTADTDDPIDRTEINAIKRIKPTGNTEFEKMVRDAKETSVTVIFSTIKYKRTILPQKMF